MSELVAGTAAVNADNVSDVSELISSMRGDKLVLKPIKGNDSKDVHISSKQAIHDHLRDPENFAASPEGWIIQEQIQDTELPGIKGITPEEDEILRRPAVHREMRVFTFINGAGGYECVPIARLFRQDETGKKSDEFVYVDPDSLPDEALKFSQIVAQRIVDVSGVPHIFGAIDVVYGAVPGQDKRWYCMEANMKEPIAVNNSEQFRTPQRIEHAQPIVKEVVKKTANLLIDLKKQNSSR